MGYIFKLNLLILVVGSILSFTCSCTSPPTAAEKAQAAHEAAYAKQIEALAAKVIVKKSDPPENCKEVGPVEGIDGETCDALPSRGNYEAAYQKLRKNVASMKANFARIDLVETPQAKMPGTFQCVNQAYIIRAVAYSCPDAKPMALPEKKPAPPTKKK